MQAMYGQSAGVQTVEDYKRTVSNFQSDQKITHKLEIQNMTILKKCNKLTTQNMIRLKKWMHEKINN